MLQLHLSLDMLLGSHAAEIAEYTYLPIEEV